LNYGDDQFLSARAAWPSRQLPSQHSRRFKFQLDLGKAPLADNFAAPVEKDPLVDVNVEVQRHRRRVKARRAMRLTPNVDLRLTAQS
jgi:hypothetical protein